MKTLCFMLSFIFGISTISMAQWLQNVKQNYYIHKFKKKKQRMAKQKEKTKQEAEIARKNQPNKINAQLHFEAEKKLTASQNKLSNQSSLLTSSASNSVLPPLPEVVIAPDALAEYQTLLNLVNEVRQKGCECGGQTMPPAPPLELDPVLVRVAELHSTDMLQNNYFNHTGKDGSSHISRYQRFTQRNNTYIGENLYMGLSYSAESAFKAWMGSPGHCRNIMNSNYRKMGAGRAGIYWTQMFMD